MIVGANSEVLRELIEWAQSLQRNFEVSRAVLGIVFIETFLLDGICSYCGQLKYEHNRRETNLDVLVGLIELAQNLERSFEVGGAVLRIFLKNILFNGLLQVFERNLSMNGARIKSYSTS